MYKAQIEKYLRKHGFGSFSPRAVLFDMDGVLFDSMPAHAESWTKVCAMFGLPTTLDEVYMNEGRTGASTINMLTEREWGRRATDEEIEQLYADKCVEFNKHPEAPRMEGADAVLRRVREAGLQQLVVTGSGQASLLDRLQESYPGCFAPERVVSSRDVRHGKPNPEPYLKGMGKAGVEPWESIVVENAPLGVRAAVAAGAFTVAVNTGPLPDQVLLDEGADLIFPSMSALADAFEAIVASAE